MTINIPLGPVMADVVGLELCEDDIRRLSHPLIGGVILFARNFASPQQLRQLTSAIHALRDPKLPIAVDHEGGRVQRFRDGFTAIPPMRALGQLWDSSPESGRQLAKNVGCVIGNELISHGLDFSFAPVLDLDWGESGVIGNRAFHHDPCVVAELAKALISGLASTGMGAVGKHFPGHGFVKADSHHAIPIDERSFAEIERTDLIPFSELARAGMSAVMPAHVIYPQVDSNPAGFSAKWLQDVLRVRLSFEGLVFSDDLSMEAAAVAGDVTQRALAALNAGCDMVLLCNNPALADELLTGLTAAGIVPTSDLSQRISQMLASPTVGSDARYMSARSAVISYAASVSN